MKKFTKGQFEYAKYKRNIEIIRTVIMFAISLSLYIGGYITTKSNKNLLTVVAVLGMLPACKSLISVIMHFRVKIQDESFREQIDAQIGKLNGLYHIYFTSADINFYIAHCVITNDSFVCFSDDSKFDEKKFYEHIDKHMKIDGISNILVKVFLDKNNYIKRISQLNELDNSDKVNEKMNEMVINISL